MVNVSSVLFKNANKTKSWIDSLRVYVKGGHGGNGLPKVGGVGGPGGHVYISASKNVKSLSEVYYKQFNDKKQRLIGGSGENASKSRVLGLPGEDVVLEVPIGIQIFDDNRRLLKDLDDDKILVRVAAGGNGGAPNNGWLGLVGQSRHVRLDLKIIADIGLVGFPNAGKSTLLKAISRAKPKIASYPFTTIKPNLGEILYPKDLRRIQVADLPGLIEGASYNVGMGHRFLKHLSRTRLLLFVIDINGFQLGKGGTHRSPFETLVLLNKELELYNSDLLQKPCLCVVNKMDVEGSEAKLQELKHLMNDLEGNARALFESEEQLCPSRFLEFGDLIPVSAKFSKTSISHLKDILRQSMDSFDDRVNSGLKSGDDIIGNEVQNSWTHPEFIISND